VLREKERRVIKRLTSAGAHFASLFRASVQKVSMTRDVDAPPSAEPPPEGAASLPHPGEIFDGKYRIERSIGHGAMAVVFEATHLQLQDRVAIKLLLPQWAQNAEWVERFMREGRAATRIRSEHVVRVFDVGVVGKHPYLVMEYLEGSDLDQALETSGALPAALAIDYVLQASEAIAEAHVRGIIHRDLKPANLFLTRRADGSSCVKVLDFGISKATESASLDAGTTAPTTVMGSPNYMSPEQMLSSKDVDARSDIWALGAILHELIACAPPFDGETFAALSAAVLRDPAPRLGSIRSDVPAPVEAAVLRCLEREPSRRFANVAELAATLAPHGSASARTSAERIARVLDGGTGKISVPIFAHATEARGEGAVALLAAASASGHARARALGYVVAAVAFIGVGSGIAWMVVKNARASHTAEQAEHAAALASAVATGAPTLTSAAGSASPTGAAPPSARANAAPSPSPAKDTNAHAKEAPSAALAISAPAVSRPATHPRWPKRGPRPKPAGIPPLPDFPVPGADPQGEPSSVPIAPAPAPPAPSILAPTNPLLLPPPSASSSRP
jgi:eukaryotic-like serine/threonine-protein kinase